MADRQHNGMAEASGASRDHQHQKHGVDYPASGLVAPLRMLVAVRASAPVAANPPNSGAMMLAMP